jgi:hypothetical protein
MTDKINFFLSESISVFKTNIDFLKFYCGCLTLKNKQTLMVFIVPVLF